VRLPTRAVAVLVALGVGVSLATAYVAAEETASAAKRGVWAGSFTAP
jgi:hypothetical protein